MKKASLVATSGSQRTFCLSFCDVSHVTSPLRWRKNDDAVYDNSDDRWS